MASSTSLIPTSSIQHLASQITSISSHYASVESVLQTATNEASTRSLYLELLQLSLSLALKQDELLIATLTNSLVRQSLSLQLPLLQSAYAVIVDNNSPYGSLHPNLAFNITLLIIFALLTAFHTFGFWYRQWWFSIAFLCACLLELLGYIGRVWSHYNIENFNPFLLQFICLTIAPVFTMGGVYYQMLKLAVVYGENYSRWKPIIYAYIFMACDIISLVIQAIGGGIAGEATTTYSSTENGTHIFVGGLALQVFSMSIFLILWFDFLYLIYTKAGKDAQRLNLPIDKLYNPKYVHIRLMPLFKYFNGLLTLAVVFVYIRCVYRVCELAEGWSGNLIEHEKYFVGLDAVMMALANLVFVPFFPGFIFDGRHTSIPVKKTHKSMKKQKNTTTAEDDDKELDYSTRYTGEI